MDDYQRKTLGAKIDNVIDKYKDNKLYPKIITIADQFKGCTPIDKTNYMELAKLTAKIDFGCYFKDGKCKEKRSNMCCCTQCKTAIGYIKTIFFHDFSRQELVESEILYYAKKFSINTGFWRANIGCILPRHRRSSTCLTYNHSDGLTTEERLLFDIISDYKKRPHYIHLLVKILKNYFLYREE